MKDKTIFITGGAGFIASHLIDRLIEDNKVIVYDNYTRDSLSLDKQILYHQNLTIVRGDVLDKELVTKSSSGADIIIHCAAIAGIYSVVNNPARTMSVNLIGSYNVLEAARLNCVNRVIDFSTSEVYGPHVYRGQETDPTIIGAIGEPRWVYALGKLASEHLTHAYGKEHGIEVVSVRPFNVYGPRQMGEGAIQQMVLKSLRGEEVMVYNDGVQIRAWCYVSDFVTAICSILDNSRCNNQVFNIGNPKTSITVLGLAEKIIEMTSSKSKIVFKKHPGAEIEVRIPNIDKAKEFLGFEPKVNLTRGLQETIDWYKEHQCQN